MLVSQLSWAHTYGRQDTNAVTVNLPATNLFAYDLNGNLLTNGNEVLIWSDENQLVTNFVAGAWKTEFVYDGLHRQRVRKEYTWQSSAWVLTNEVHNLFMGTQVVQERNASNVPQVTYTFGNGRLARTTATGSAFYHTDGRQNVTMLVDANGMVQARYLYDPFGNLLAKSGPLADANLYRFAGQEVHVQSGLIRCYFRYYDPNLQRWLNRDPIGLLGGVNLHTYVGNDPISLFDPFGLDCWVVESEGGFGHQWFIGQNPDGTYWQTDLMPKNSGGIRTPDWGWLPDGIRNVPLHCKAEPTNPKPSGFDPKDLPKDMKVAKHKQCSKSVDKETKEYVADLAKESPYWNAAGNNCKDYTDNLTHVVSRFNRMEKVQQKQQKSPNPEKPK